MYSGQRAKSQMQLLNETRRLYIEKQNELQIYYLLSLICFRSYFLDKVAYAYEIFVNFFVSFDLYGLFGT